MSEPVLSVLMAVYNGEKYIRESIDSVLSQDFEAFEFVIVDDGSTDGTASIIKGYGDPRIVYVRNETNLGQTRSLNVALARARGSLLCRIDADDVFLPGKLRRQFDFMEAHPEIAVCGTAAMRIDAEGEQVTINRLPSEPLDIRFRVFRTVPVIHVSVIMRKEAIFGVGGYPERYRYAADFALWSELMRRSQRITNLPDVLVQYREFDETFGAAQKVGSGGDEAAGIVFSNVRAFTGQELSMEECRAMALLYFPASGAGVDELCSAFMNLRRLAGHVYPGRVPLRVQRGLLGTLFWSLLKSMTSVRGRVDSPGESAPARGSVGAALGTLRRRPDAALVLILARALAPLGERRVVNLKNAVKRVLSRGAGR
jgi:hypothetical protein